MISTSTQGITAEKLNNLLWGIFSFFHTRVPTPNEQTILPFVILPLYFCSDLSLQTSSYILFYCSYLDVAIFDDVMKLEFNFFLKVSTSTDWFTILYTLCYYIKQPPYFSSLYCYTFQFCFSYYITFCFYHFYFTSIFHED